MNYLNWNEKTITDFCDENVNSLYNEGYVFTRKGNGVMQKTRSLRIDLSEFELSSENRRILRKTEDLRLKIEDLPYKNYNWEIGKMAKDFYTEKFGDGTFSANKIRELLTNDRQDFSRLFVYSIQSKIKNQKSKITGYCISAETDQMIHYSYPFYEIQNSKFKIQNLGMGMMLRAIEYAKESGKKYIYLGSFQRPGDVYKLQFKGLEWFDGKGWSKDLEKLKEEIKGKGSKI